jgi:hypothetical protein
MTSSSVVADSEKFITYKGYNPLIEKAIQRIPEQLRNETSGLFPSG